MSTNTTSLFVFQPGWQLAFGVEVLVPIFFLQLLGLSITNVEETCQSTPALVVPWFVRCECRCLRIEISRLLKEVSSPCNYTGAPLSLLEKVDDGAQTPLETHHSASRPSWSWSLRPEQLQANRDSATSLPGRHSLQAWGLQVHHWPCHFRYSWGGIYFNRSVGWDSITKFCTPYSQFYVTRSQGTQLIRRKSRRLIVHHR